MNSNYKTVIKDKPGRMNTKFQGLSKQAGLEPVTWK